MDVIQDSSRCHVSFLCSRKARPQHCLKKGTGYGGFAFHELLEGQDNRMKKKIVMCLSHCQKVGRIQLVKVHATSKHAPCRLQVSGLMFINRLLPGLETVWTTPEWSPCVLIPTTDCWSSPSLLQRSRTCQAAPAPSRCSSAHRIAPGLQFPIPRCFKRSCYRVCLLFNSSDLKSLKPGQHWRVGGRLGVGSLSHKMLQTPRDMKKCPLGTCPPHTNQIVASAYLD